MFEDQNQNSVPGANSSGKVEDIFSDTDKSTPAPPAPSGAVKSAPAPTPAQPGPPTALSGGKLHAAANAGPNIPSSQVTGTANSSKKIFIILGIGVLFVVVVGAGYIYWKNNLITTSQEQETEQSNEQDTTTPPETNEDNTDTDTDTDTNEDDPESSGNFFDDFNKRSTDNVLNPVPDPAKTDTDQDGLSDAQEYDIGTNPRLVDSDNDGLSDWEEYAIFGTNPINSDTDSDTFLDGEEVQNGYDPNGPGKLLNIEN